MGPLSAMGLAAQTLIRDLSFTAGVSDQSVPFLSSVSVRFCAWGELRSTVFGEGWP